MAQSVYLDFLFRFFAVPIAVLGVVVWPDWFCRRKTLGTTIVCTAVFGFFCDTLAVHTGLWQYDTGRPNLGVRIFKIPIEEFLFYTLFPLLVLSVWCTAERAYRIVSSHAQPHKERRV